jgi:Cu-processing system permease protein
MNLKNIKNIAINSTAEYLYSKFSYLLAAIVILLIYISILVGIMAVQEERKVLLDFFVSITQISLLLFAVFSSSLSISNDIETKRIYMILSRPVRKSEYMLGKISGVYISSFLLLLLINIVCVVVLFAKGYSVSSDYLLSLLNVYIKIVVISSISVLFTSLTTSAFTSVAITTMIWFISHFITELNYALNRVSGIEEVFKYIIYIFPNFSSSLSADGMNFVLHTFLYLVAVIVFTVLSFERKEF